MSVPPGEKSGVRATAVGWVRRRPVVASLLVVLIAIRVALPSIVRSQLEKQVTAAVTGRLTVGDVDLSLLRGSVALEEVALRADDAPPADPPVVGFRRLYVNVGYFALLRHTLRVQAFEIDAPAVALARVKSGAVPLIGPRPAAAEPEKKPEAAGKPWNVVVDQAVLREGRLRLKDEVPDPPETAELALDGLGLKNFKLLRTADGKPGQGTIEAKFGDGAIRLDNVIRTRREGFALQTTVDISNLPLDRAQLHAPQLGWSGLTGRLDAHIVFRAEPNSLPGSTGSLALRDLRIDVPGEDAPALAWRKLVVDIEELSLVHQRAIVKTITLDGGSVLVTPKAPAPLPLLAGILGKPAPADAPKPPPAEPSKPWTWKVGKVELTDTKASVTLEPPPLLIEVVKGTITGLDGTPGAQAQVDVQVRHREGTIGVTGDVGLEPLALKLQTRIAGLALGPLAAASGTSPVRVPSGTLDADLGIQAEQGTLALDGKLGVADLAVRAPAGEDFALDWKRLDLAIRELRVPGAAPGPAPPPTEPIRADLEELRLVAPVVSLTRDPTGLVLPTSTGSAPPAVEAPAAPPANAPPSPPGRPLALSLGRLALEKGQVSLVDRAVKPFYRGTISAMTLQATDLRFPDNTFAAFTFTATLPGGAPLKLEGKQAKGTANITAEGKKLPLKQFNPYVTPAGYSIADGALTVGATVRYGAAGYDSKTKVEFDKLGVAGAEGDSLFKQKVGIPLQLAISLLRDIQGRISLNIPVSGDKSGTRVAIGSIVAEALVKAIIGAVASPLKMFGAVVDLAGGSGAAAAPEPIPYRPGLLDPEDKERVEQVAEGLAGAPGLKVSLNGMAGGPDVRGLQEKAVLADLQAKQSVFGGIRNLANRGERNAIRDALAARAGGDKGELSPEHEKVLDEWAGEKQVSDDDLRALATARAERLRDQLVRDHGIDAARVAAGDPDVNRTEGRPGVGVALGF